MAEGPSLDPNDERFTRFVIRSRGFMNTAGYLCRI